jgi:hypothetical protein
MKNSFVKILLLVPSLLFLDWLIMIIAGCISNMCGAEDHFFCTIYCNFGIVLMVSTFLFMVYLVLRSYLSPHHNSNV